MGPANEWKLGIGVCARLQMGNPCGQNTLYIVPCKIDCLLLQPGWSPYVKSIPYAEIRYSKV